MSGNSTGWADRVRAAKASGLVAREFFVVLTEPAAGKDRVRETLAEHLEYQRRLEREGIILAAGPLSDETGAEWTGKGLIIYRAASLAEAQRIAAEDPMHKSGARTYKVLPWLMNEGSFTLRVKLAGQKIEFD